MGTVGTNGTGRERWERYLKFRCTGCGNCCRGTHVMITDADVRRITEGTGRPVHEFVKFTGEDDVEMTTSSPWWIRFDNRRALMTLRWQVGSKCTFLGEDERCEIYEHRPLTCRHHPLSVTLSETGAVMKLSMSRVVRCPAEWDGSLTRRELAGLERWSDRESVSFLEHVRAWNRDRSRRRTPARFLQYVGLRD